MKPKDFEEGKYYRLVTKYAHVHAGSIFVGTERDCICDGTIQEIVDMLRDDPRHDPADQADEGELCGACVWSPDGKAGGYTVFSSMQHLEFEPCDLLLEGLDP